MLLTPEPKFGRDHQQDKRQVYIFFAQPSGNCMILDKVPSASNSAKQKKGNDPEMSKNLPRVHLPARSRPGACRPSSDTQKKYTKSSIH